MSPESPPPSTHAPVDIVEYSLDQLSTFHKIAGYIHLVFSLCGLPHTLFGLFFTISPPRPTQGEMPPPFFGAVFMAAGLAVMAAMIGLGVANFAASRWIRERRQHTGIQVVAAFDCLNMPLGTLLGVYTLVTVNKPEVRARFTR